MKPVPATVDVALSTLDQQSPETDKPIGRLRKLINAKVKQYQNPRAADGTTTHVKVEKRDAFVTIDDATDDTDGVAQTPPSGTPQVLFGGGDALRMVVDNRLYTKTTNWVKASNQADGDTVVLPQTLRSSPIYTADSQAEAPDFAVIGDTECTVWREVSTSRSNNDPTFPAVTAAVNTVLDGVRVQVASSSGVIRPAFTLDPEALGTTVYMKARVVAQGGYFWVIQDFQTNLPLRAVQIDVTVLNTLGVVVGSTSIAGANYNESWDVTVLTTDGVVIAMPAAVAGVTFTAMTFNGATVTKTTNTDATIKCRATQCAWMTDDTGTAHTGYLVTADDVSGPVGPLTATNLYGYRIVSLAKDHEYPVVLSAANQAVQYLSAITGYHVPGGNDLVVSYALMDIVGVPEATTYGAGTPDEKNNNASDFFPDQMNNLVGTFAMPFTGVSTVISTRFGMSLASRAFAVGADYVAIGYYPGVKFGPLEGPAATPHFPYRPVDPSNFQPCWYVLPLALPQAIAGRFEYGLATADYQDMVANVSHVILPNPRNRCLTSTAVLETGAIGIPLGYRAEQNIPSGALFSGTPQEGQPVGDLPTLASYQTNNTVGVKRFTIGPDCGQPFVVGQATYFPGLMAAIVEPGEVIITEQGLTAPECPRVKQSAVAYAVSVSGAYFYRVAFEYTTKGGRMYRSLPSAAFAYTNVQADNLALEITQHNLAVTNKKAVKTSIYRTGIIDAITDGTQASTTPPTQSAGTAVTSVPSVGAYKITDDLHPFYSNPALSTSAFDDYMTIGSQGTGELLYTDQGYLPRYPAPALRGGCVWQNRAWVIGYDNALWFSGQIAEGEGEWFNPGQRVVIPTNEAVTAIASLDSFLLIFCERSIWYLPESTLPDSTGTGTIPPAIRLPFEMGGTGFSSVIRQGCLYSSSAGGVWMITRSLDNVWIGQAAQDDLSPTVTSMVIAGNNVLVGNASYMMAYDTNLGAWARWELPISTTLVGASGGAAVTANSGLVWQQTPGQYQDQDTVHETTTYVPLTVGVSPVHIAGVRSWKRTWAIQAQGQTADPCDVAFTLSYGDYNTTTKTYLPATLDVGTLEEEIRPTLQLATSVGFEMVDAENVDTVTGQGYSLEVISFYIGKEPTLKQLPKGKRPLT